MFLGKKTGKLETTSDFMQQLSRSDQKSQQAILRIIQGKESYCSSIHQQSAAIRSSPSSVPFSSLCGSLKTCELHSLLLKHRITRSLPKMFLVHRNRSTSTLFWDHWQAIQSQSCTPSPCQRKARTPSSSELVSQEGLYLLMIVLSVSPSRVSPTGRLLSEAGPGAIGDGFCPQRSTRDCAHPVPPAPAHTLQKQQNPPSLHIKLTRQQLGQPILKKEKGEEHRPRQGRTISHHLTLI